MVSILRRDLGRAVTSSVHADLASVFGQRVRKLRRGVTLTDWYALIVVGRIEVCRRVELVGRGRVAGVVRGFGVVSRVVAVDVGLAIAATSGEALEEDHFPRETGRKEESRKRDGGCAGRMALIISWFGIFAGAGSLIGRRAIEFCRNNVA